MPLRTDRRSVLPGLLLAAGLLGALAGRAADAPQPPTRQQVREAVAQVRLDPDLPRKHMEKKLRFKESTGRQPDAKSQRDMQWLRDFIRWLAEAGRLLMWALGAVAVAVLAVGLRHWVRQRADAALPARPVYPSHVRSLDIRPESLPDAIGATAAALWQRGEQRAALSLLYRGILSRLVHQHALPIRAASTEGECLALAQGRLDAQRGAFATVLVQAWQLAVYGARLPQPEQVLQLCRDFDQHFGVTQAGRATP